MNIKQFKPHKNGRFKQGYINPGSCKKLFEGLERQPIIYRSSWEKRFIYWCEMNANVKNWGSECLSIKYFLPSDQKWHTYYPDFFIEMQSGKKLVIEIKPSNQVEKPKADNCWAMHTWEKNHAKWKTIEAACKDKGYEFNILTEKTINRL